MGKGKGQEKGRNLLWNDYLLVLEKEAASMRGGYSQPGAPCGQVTAWRIWRELPEAWVGLLHPAWTPGPLGALHLTCSSRVWAVGLQSPRVPDWAPRVPSTSAVLSRTVPPPSTSCQSLEAALIFPIHMPHLLFRRLTSCPSGHLASITFCFHYLFLWKQRQR